MSQSSVPLNCINTSGGDGVHPEGNKSHPTCETMHRLKVVMIFDTETRMSASENREEHGKKNVRSDDVGDLVASLGIDEFLGGYSGVKQIPDDGSYTGS